MRTLITFILLFTICFSAYSQYPDSPSPWNDAYNFSTDNFQFKHPMTVFDNDELVIIKQRIKYAVEPQTTAFIHLMKEAEEALNFSPNPPVTLQIPGGYVDAEGLENARTVLWDNSYAAYTCALAYTFTNQEKYAEKAVSILTAWANKGTNFTGDDSGLQLGSYFSSMLYAADLLYNYEGWLASDKAKFKTWWTQECVLSGEVLRVMRKKDNNWKDAGLLGVFAASVVLEDYDYLKEALVQLKSYFFTRTDGNVDIPGDSWKISNDEKGVYLPREVVRNDGRSGLTYTAYALSSMVQCFEIARYAGHNFWYDTTVHGVGIVDVIKQYYRWDVGDEVFPWDSNANKSDKRRNLYELANTRFELDDDIKEFIQSNRPIAGREGDAYTTLNKGDMTGWDTTVLAVPEIQKVERLSSTQLKVQWTVAKDNYYGFIIEREENNQFVVLDTLEVKCISYLDTGLKPGTNYTYRIGVFNASKDIVYSAEIMAATFNSPNDVPVQPDNLSTKSVGSDKISLLWTDNSDNEEGFVIERKSNNGFSIIGQVGVNDTIFLDTNLDFNSKYTYRVYAENVVGKSAYSNEASSTTIFSEGIFEENNGVVSMEAEHGDLGTRWQIKKDESLASGKEFIEVNSQFNDGGSSPSCDVPTCYGIYYFHISTVGNYSFWFRTLSSGGEDDSFFWRIDGSAWITENGRSGIGKWFSTDNDQTNNLVEGVHVLEVANRENGTQLDKFIIQVDNNQAPSGEGASESLVYGCWLPRYPTDLREITNVKDTITIRWEDTAANEDGFIIERKQNETFEIIAEVKSNHLSFVDYGITPNSSYFYRVKSFNECGQSMYSNVINVLSVSNIGINSSKQNVYNFKIYPNPANDFVNISYSVPTFGVVDLSVFNMMGSKVMGMKSEVEKGMHNIQLPLLCSKGKRLPSGTYLSVFLFNSSIATEKIVLM